MQLRFAQLKGCLERTEVAVLLVTGDEPYQHMLAVDMFRVHKEKAGFTDRKILTVEAGFDWSELDAAKHALSLFGEQTLIDLRIPTGKPGASGSKAIVNFVQDLHPEVALLIQAPRLDRATMGSAWVKALDKSGVVVRVWPLSYAETENWIGKKLKAEGFTVDRETITFIAQQVEGNLLAARQELEKIVLVVEQKELTFEVASRVLTDSSHYSLKELTDVLATGEVARLVRILKGLEKEDIRPPLLLWAMTERARKITNAGSPSTMTRGAPGALNPLMRLSHIHQQNIGVREDSQASGNTDLLRQCAWVDRVIKGQGDGNPWHELIQLGIAIQLAGQAGQAPGEGHPLASFE